MPGHDLRLLSYIRLLFSRHVGIVSVENAVDTMLAWSKAYSYV
jgi:hypothetical protein